MWRFVFKTCGDRDCKCCQGRRREFISCGDWLAVERRRVSSLYACPMLRFDSVSWLDPDPFFSCRPMVLEITIHRPKNIPPIMIGPDTFVYPQFGDE